MRKIRANTTVTSYSAQSDRRRTEASGGNIEVSIWTECHGGGQVQSSCDFGVLVLAVNAQTLAGAGRGGRIARCVLEELETAPAIQCQSEDSREIDGDCRDMAAWRDFQDFRGFALDRQPFEVADIEVLAVRHDGGRHDVSLGVGKCLRGGGCCRSW